MRASSSTSRTAVRFGLTVSLALTACGGAPDAAGAEAAVEAQEALAPEPSLSSSCAGLVPSTPGTPRQVHYAFPAGPNSSSCTSEATADGQGTLAIQQRNTYDAPGGADFTWNLLGPSGAVVGQLPAKKFSRELHAQAVGFHLGNGADFNTGFSLDAFDGQGNLLRRTPFAAQDAASWASALDESGGSAVVFSTCASTYCDAGGWRLLAQRFDAAGAPSGPPGAVASAPSGTPPGAGANSETSLQVGVDALGLALVLWDGAAAGYGANTLAGRWLSRSGAPLTPVFLAASGLALSAPAHLRPLLGGGLALQLDGKWVRQFPSGQARGEAAPAWLAARPNTTLELLPGHRGYALLPPAGAHQAPCEQAVAAPRPGGQPLRRRPLPAVRGRLRDGAALPRPRRHRHPAPARHRLQPVHLPVVAAVPALGLAWRRSGWCRP